MSQFIGGVEMDKEKYKLTLLTIITLVLLYIAFIISDPGFGVGY